MIHPHPLTPVHRAAELAAAPRCACGALATERVVSQGFTRQARALCDGCVDVYCDVLRSVGITILGLTDPDDGPLGVLGGAV